MNPYAYAYHSLQQTRAQRLRWQIQNFDSDGFIRVNAGEHALKVWYHRPQGWTKDAPVLFVMHGVKRNARNYRRSWITHAEANNFLLLVPEFSRSRYPGTDKYHFGNTFSPSGQPLAPSQWTYTMIEHIFDIMKILMGFHTTTYSIYGHSAGAQFVHRMLLFLPSARIETAICANAGWYMLPSYEATFPYGLRTSGIRERDVKKAFAKNLLILLGEDDTHPSHKYLKQTFHAQAQGDNRYERGHYFYQTARREAARLRVPLAWELRVVHGVGHNNTRMTIEAVQALYQERRECPINWPQSSLADRPHVRPRELMPGKSTHV